ncbi:hypothetical protein PENSTE_c009G10115 [Penicillium steckii]|uniref:Major facilitator superfamily (MFS) profile domain-containing protein n=1 Tax=Penicillium steckii TaxID=303698 RepID=A0A1V6TAN7_9EURO|nr:hypothetical protein PENSTE_c009G10115 [Penicillium steckii]
MNDQEDRLAQEEKERSSPTIEDTSSSDDDYYPEGGWRAWSVVFGAWCAMIPSMGLLNSLGILHAWTSTHQLKDHSESSIGWIFGAYGFFLYFAGAQAGPIFDAYGPNYIIIPGSIGIVVALVCFSFSEAPRIGFPWAIRIIALLSAIMCALACLLLKTRLPQNLKAGATIDFKALKEPNYAVTTIAVFLVEFAVFIPITYISSYAIHVGINDRISYLLIAFLNVGAIPGRFLPGLIADRLGRFNVMALTSFVCAILTLALWLKSGDNLAAIICYAVFFGFWSGAAISLTPVCISQVCATQDYGKRNGTTFTIVSIGTLTGIPIAGAIQQRDGGEYEGLIIFGGVLYLAAAVAFTLARGVCRGWSLKTKF